MPNKYAVFACTGHLAGGRVAQSPGVRNAFWDSVKSTVILIRVATGRHLNARAHARGISHGGVLYGGFFCNSHLCNARARALHREQDW